LDMQKLAKLKARRRALKHSTGEQSLLKHATGKEFDYKVEYEEFSEEEEKLREENEQQGDKGR